MTLFSCEQVSTVAGIIHLLIIALMQGPYSAAYLLQCSNCTLSLSHKSHIAKWMGETSENDQSILLTVRYSLLESRQNAFRTYWYRTCLCSWFGRCCTSRSTITIRPSRIFLASFQNGHGSTSSSCLPVPSGL